MREREKRIVTVYTQVSTMGIVYVILFPYFPLHIHKGFSLLNSLFYGQTC
jgi:hypothetical protein